MIGLLNLKFMEYKVGTLVLIKGLFTFDRKELGIIADDTEGFKLPVEKVQDDSLVIYDAYYKHFRFIKIRPYDQDFWWSHTLEHLKSPKEYLSVDKDMLNSVIIPFMYQFGDFIVRKSDGIIYRLVKITWEGEFNVKNRKRSVMAMPQFRGTLFHLQEVGANRSQHIRLKELMEDYDLHE